MDDPLQMSQVHCNSLLIPIRKTSDEDGETSGFFITRSKQKPILHPMNLIELLDERLAIYIVMFHIPQ